MIHWHRHEMRALGMFVINDSQRIWEYLCGLSLPGDIKSPTNWTSP
jgi:hypothetical protein